MNCHPCRRTEKHGGTRFEKCHLCRRTRVTDAPERNCYRCSRLHTGFAPCVREATVTRADDVAIENAAETSRDRFLDEKIVRREGWPRLSAGDLSSNLFRESIARMCKAERSVHRASARASARVGGDSTGPTVRDADSQGAPTGAVPVRGTRGSSRRTTAITELDERSAGVPDAPRSGASWAGTRSLLGGSRPHREWGRGA